MVMERVDRIFSSAICIQEEHSRARREDSSLFGEERGFEANDEPALLPTLGCVC